SDDTTLKVWDASSGSERFTLSGHTGEVNGCAISPDGSFIVSASNDTTLKVWDASSGSERFTLSGHHDRITRCIISPDSQLIISTSIDTTLRVWSATSGQHVLTFPVDGELMACTFYPDGEHLIVGGSQGMFFLRLVQEKTEP